MVVALLFYCGLVLGAQKSCLAQDVNNLVLMTEQFPPFNYAENGELKGISVDLLEMMLVEVGSKLTRKDMRLLPWARGYRDALEKENTVLFITNRNPLREELFKWVGPILTTEFGLIAKKNRKIRITSRDEINRYKIGVVSKDYGEMLLHSLGIKPVQIEPVPTPEINVHKLNRHRIDLWNYEVTVAAWIISQAGFNPHDYEVAYLLKQDIGAYFAFHNETDDAIITLFQGALDQMKLKKPGQTKSQLETIVNRYIKGTIDPLR